MNLDKSVGRFEESVKKSRFKATKVTTGTVKEILVKNLIEAGVKRILGRWRLT